MKKILLLVSLLSLGQSAFGASDLTVYSCSMPTVISEAKNLVKGNQMEKAIERGLTIEIIQIGNSPLDRDLLTIIKENYLNKVDISEFGGEINWTTIHSADVICLRK